MKRSSSSEANRFSASQGIPRILWNSKVHCLVYNSPPIVPNLVPFPLLRLHQGISPRRRQLWMVHDVVIFMVRICQHVAQHPRWKTTTFQLSATAYSTCTQLRSILETFRSSATWGRAASWWQRPTYRAELSFNPLSPELNPICYLLALLGAHHFLHVSRIRVKLLTFTRLMSYIYGAPILDVSRSHTTTQHSR